MEELENSGGCEEEITREDLIAYDSGKCDDPKLRERIAREAEKEGSFVQRWMAEMDRRAADPFGLIDWGKVQAAGGEEELKRGDEGGENEG